MYKLRKSYRLGCGYCVISHQLVDKTMTVNMMPEEKAKENESGSQYAPQAFKGLDWTWSPEKRRKVKRQQNSRNMMPNT